MIYRLLFLLLSIQIYPAVSSSAVVLGASALTAVYPIDSNHRGTEIINTFKSLTHAAGTQVPEIALQTTLPNTNAYQTYKYINNGLINYVQSITPTTYNTLLIVGYQSTAAASVTQYVVLPAEQVTALLYFPRQNTLPTSNAPFSSSVISGTLPYFSVDPKQRATDIASAVTTLLAAPFKVSPQTQVWIQTTLTGPFNPPVPNGLLQNVTAISVSSSLINIQFLPNGNGQSTPTTILVAPEQIQQVTYILNYNTP